MTRHLSKANKLRDVYSIKSGVGNITVLKWKVNSVEIKIIAFVWILDETNSSDIDKSKSKIEALVYKVFLQHRFCVIESVLMAFTNGY